MSITNSWYEYFQANSQEPDLPWDDPYRLSAAERQAVIASIQQFQLGENAGGTRLLRRAEARRDPEYTAALRLFVGEEQRHSRILARFLELQGSGCLKRHWVHGAFRWVRGLAGLELFMRVLATAEVVAVPYYDALSRATNSPLLREICRRILREEAVHLQFQSFTFQRLAGYRPSWLRRLVCEAHRGFLTATVALVWREHRAVLQAGGYSLFRFWQRSMAQFATMTGSPAIPIDGAGVVVRQV